MATLLFTSLAQGAGWNPFWTSFAGFVGSAVDQRLLGEKLNVSGPRMSDLSLQTATAGACIPKAFGSVRVSGNVIWGTDFVEHANTQSAGGKGGSGGSYTTYTYTVSFAVALCQGPIRGIGRVWADGNVVDMTQYTYSVYLGTESQLPDSFIEGIEGVGNVPAHRGLAYVVFQNMDVTPYGSRIPSFSFEVFSAVNDLGEIVVEISDDVGVTASQLDVTGITGMTVPGYLYSGSKSARDHIQLLQQIYIFDGMEIAGSIVFKRRDYTKVYTVPADDMGAYESEMPPKEPFTVTRTPDLELPESVTLQYLSLDNDYQQGTITSRRYLTNSASSVVETVTGYHTAKPQSHNRNRNVDVEYVMHDADAKRVTDTMLYQLWLERSTYEVTLGPKHGELRPGTVIELVCPSGQNALALVTKTSFGKPGLQKVTSVSTYSALYSQVTRVVDPGDSSVTPEPPTAVNFEFLDIPQLPWDTATVNSDSIYVATNATEFYGAIVFQSTDGGVTYHLLEYKNPLSTMGTVTNALGDGATNFFDYANALTIVLTSGSLQSQPVANVLNGANAAVVGGEVIQYLNAALVAPHTWQLSGLLRGRLGTEHLTNSHVAGERFILLDRGTVGKITVTASQWYLPLMYRVGPAIRPVTDSSYTERNFMSNGNMALPLSPCHVTGSRDAAGNLTMNWVRRARGSSGWQDYVDVPLNEVSEQYSLEILKNGAVARTINAASPTAIYFATMQEADFGGIQSAVNIRIYQVSATRGRGTGTEVTL